MMNLTFSLSLPRFCLALGFALLLSAPARARGQQTNTSSGLDFSDFRIIAERNIFNPRRSARYTPRTETRRAPQVESFALVGTMSYEKGPFAFFDGTSSDYRKALKQDETIAGYKVTHIEPGFVKLAGPTNEIELRVGMQLSREAGGEWRLGARPESQLAAMDRPSQVRPPVPTPPANPEEATEIDPLNAIRTPDGPMLLFDPNAQVFRADPTLNNNGTNLPPAAAAGGTESDILRRLMQRREQENNQ